MSGRSAKHKAEEDLRAKCEARGWTVRKWFPGETRQPKWKHELCILAPISEQCFLQLDMGVCLNALDPMGFIESEMQSVPRIVGTILEPATS